MVKQSIPDSKSRKLLQTMIISLDMERLLISTRISVEITLSEFSEV